MSYSITCDCCGRPIPEGEVYLETTALRWACNFVTGAPKVLKSLDTGANAHYCAECYEPPRPRRGGGHGRE